MSIVAAVGLMAGGAALLGGGLVQVLFLQLLGLIAMAGETCRTGSGCKKPGDFRRAGCDSPCSRPPRPDAAPSPLRSASPHLRGKSRRGTSDSLLGQNNFVVLGRRVAGVALLAFKGVVHEGLHQLRVPTGADRGTEGNRPAMG